MLPRVLRQPHQQRAELGRAHEGCGAGRCGLAGGGQVGIPLPWARSHVFRAPSELSAQLSRFTPDFPLSLTPLAHSCSQMDILGVNEE